MVLENINIVLEDEIVFGNLVIENKKIKKIIKKGQYKNGFDFLMPGFIDSHIHGSGLSDTMDNDLFAIKNISKNVVRFGTTSIIPTTMTMPYDSIKQSIINVYNEIQKSEYANILGINLEGPFISNKMLGAQNSEYVKEIDVNFLKENNKESIIKIITVAPEKVDIDKLIKYCNKENIIVSLGHSDASYDETDDALKKGARLFTHAYNAMSKFSHRKPNMVGAMLLSGGDVYCELIADLIHVKKEAIMLLVKNKGFSNIILITDAISAQGMEISKVMLGGQEVFIKDGMATLKNGNLAGSILTQDKALKNLLSIYPNRLVEISKMLSYNIARLLNIKTKGLIKEEYDADLVLFNKDFEVLKTFVLGRLVYEK